MGADGVLSHLWFRAGGGLARVHKNNVPVVLVPKQWYFPGPLVGERRYGEHPILLLQYSPCLLTPPPMGVLHRPRRPFDSHHGFHDALLRQ